MNFSHAQYTAPPPPHCIWEYNVSKHLVWKLSCVPSHVFDRLQAEQREIKLKDTLANLPPLSREFLLLQARVHRSSDNRAVCRNIPKKIKEMSLQIIHQSPASYKVLRTYFCLPSPTTLRRFLNRLVGQFKVSKYKSVGYSFL